MSARALLLPTPQRALLVCLCAAVLAACDGPTASPVDPAIDVADQYLVSGRVKVAQADVNEAGWIVIRRPQARGGFEVLGALPVGAGEHRRMTVYLAEQATKAKDCGEISRVWATLYHDGGQRGVFESEGPDAPDQPVLWEGQPVEQAFYLYHTEAIPEAHLFVTDQDMGRGYVLIEEVKMSEPGDVVIHRDKGDLPLVPGIIGKLALEEGVHQNVEVPLFEGERVACREQLWPMLHVRSTSDSQPYDLDQPVITAPVVRTCSETSGR